MHGGRGGERPVDKMRGYFFEEGRHCCPLDVFTFIHAREEVRARVSYQLVLSTSTTAVKPSIKSCSAFGRNLFGELPNMLTETGGGAGRWFDHRTLHAHGGLCLV